MRRLVRASLKSSITSPRDLAKPSSPVSPDLAASTSAHSLDKTAAWVTESAQTSPESLSHWLVLIPYRFHAGGFNFSPIVRECREGETRVVIKRFLGRGFPLNDDIHAPEVCFASRVVSRNHAEIWCEIGGDFCIRDVSSSSGTFLNGERLSESGQNSTAFPLRDGDVLQLGVEVDDGVEMADRAVKIRVVIGHGRRRGRMRASLVMPLLAPEPAAEDEQTASSEWRGQDLRLTEVEGIPIESARETFPENSLKITRPSDLAEEDPTAKRMPGTGAQNRNDPSPVEITDPQLILLPVHMASREESAPPRYRTPSPAIPSPRADREEQSLGAIPLSMCGAGQPTVIEATAEAINNDLTRYASANRHMISPELESKLLRAHYLPEDDPDEISPEEWQREYGVGYFELKRLRQLYARHVAKTSEE